MSDGRGTQPGAGGGGRRRYRVAGSGDWAATVASGAAQPVDPAGAGHVADLVPGYVLGALEPAERELVDRHVRSCPACAELLAADGRVAGFLPYLAPAVAPAPDVKAALFARIAHAERAAQERAAPGAIAPVSRALPTLPSSRPAAASLAPMEPAGKVPALAAARARPAARRPWLGTLLGAPLVLALVVVGGWGYQMHGQAVEARARADQIEALYANFAAGEFIPLQPGQAEPGAEGNISVSKDGRQVLIGFQVKNPKRDRTYNVWVNDGTRLVQKGGEIAVNPDGQGVAVVNLDRPYNEYQSIEVKAVPITGKNSSESMSDIVLSDVSRGSIGGTETNPNDVLP